MWLALVLASLLLLAALGWRLFTRVRALLREVREASRRVGEAQTEAGTAFDAWLVERAAQDSEYLATLDPPAGASDRGLAGRTMTATDPKGY
jgi:hypothetical protein